MTDGRYLCKVASLEEMHRRWDDEIRRHSDPRNWIAWKDEAIRNFREGRSIPYYGILDGTIICEATAVLEPDLTSICGAVPEERTAELCAFRTVKEARGQGYFSVLMDYLQSDLKQRGFTKAIVGVEPKEAINRSIYRHWGFTEFIGTAKETYPDGTVIDVEFYRKTL